MSSILHHHIQLVLHSTSITFNMSYSRACRREKQNMLRQRQIQHKNKHYEWESEVKDDNEHEDLLNRLASRNGFSDYHTMWDAYRMGYYNCFDYYMTLPDDW